jgi:4-aminobutyrate aminotransferase-like enzyme
MIAEMEEADLRGTATRMGARLTGHLLELQERSTMIGQVRGPGLMIGVDLVRDRETREPANTEAAEVVNEAFRRGLLIGRSGPVFGAFGNVLKFKPAANLTADEVDEMAEKFADSLAAVESRR